MASKASSISQGNIISSQKTWCTQKQLVQGTSGKASPETKEAGKQTKQKINSFHARTLLLEVSVRENKDDLSPTEAERYSEFT